jgi:uncharacterized delta-60 repeat protein
MLRLLVCCFIIGLSFALCRPVTSAPEWVTRVDPPAGSSEYAADAAVDIDGNLVMTGTVSGLGDSDILTAKFSPAGHLLWSRRHNSAHWDDDSGVAVAADHSGNVFVAGNGPEDIITIKYSPAGDVLWVRRYGSAEYDFSDDRVVDIGTDKAGSLFILGSTGGGAYHPYLTVKYTATGSVAWSRRYQHPGIGGETPAAIAVDGDGNVTVTGRSAKEDMYSDYATVRYSTNGDELWVARYSSRTAPSEDAATSVCVDSAGNTYVTGQSVGDFATVKYSPNGTEMWVRRWGISADQPEGGIAVRVGGDGTVLVAGHSWSGYYGGRQDIIVLKYTLAGDHLFSRRFATPREEVPTDLVVDSTGAATVTGYSRRTWNDSDFITIRFSPDGETLWSRRYSHMGIDRDFPASLSLDDQGNTYSVGTSHDPLFAADMACVKYSPGGDQVWVVHHRPTSASIEEVIAAKVDQEGNTIVLGRSSSNSYHLIAAKVAANGEERWVIYPGMDDGRPITGIDATVDSRGNLYVLGSSGYDGVVLKYDPQGRRVWSSALSLDYANPIDIAADAAGNIAVTGQGNTNRVPCVLTVRLRVDGTVAWYRFYARATSLYNTGRSVRFDATGNIYVAASTYTVATGQDFTAIKYGPSGGLLWAKSFDSNSRDNVPADLAVTSDGGMVLTGVTPSSQFTDFLTVGYATDGTFRWSATYDGPVQNQDEARRVELDGAGNAYVAGWAPGGRWHDWSALVSYSPDGIQRWAVQPRVPGALKFVDLGVTAAGPVVFFGEYRETTDGPVQFGTVWFNPEGAQLRFEQHAAENGGIARPASVGIMPDSGAVVVGSLPYGRHNTDYTIVKYAP